ncbi:phospholipase-like protein [Tanacetum coccineum]
MESLYGFRSIHGANCTVDIDIEMTRHREEVEEEKWWSCGGGGVAVRRLWFRRGGVAVDPPVALTLRSKLSLIKSLKDDTETVPFTYTINGHEIQFGREEFCLITGLRFGVEFSDDYLHGPLDLGIDEFGKSHVDGQEPKNNVPKWWLSLVDDINMWEKYPWGSYIWPKLYRQLKDANPKRWERFYASLRGHIRRPAKYTLSGFTWAFKTWILEAYKERALNYYTHVDRHPRAVAWVNGETFYRSYLEPFFEGAEPIRRLRADAFEAKAEWWVSSRAFFDGHICEPPQIPTAVSNDLYQRVAEHNRLIKELQQQNVDQYKIMNSMNKNFKEGLNASSMPGPMKAPFEVREHFGLSDLSGFQNTECGPQLFTTQASGSFLEGTQTTPTYPRTPHIGTPMSQPGFASCSSRYLPSHPGTPYVGTPLALQGFAPFSSNYQAGPSHSRDVFGVRAKRDTRPSKYFLSPYRPLPETTIAPTKRVNNNRKTMRNDEISPFDLANAGIDLNQPLEEEVMVTGSCATDEYLSFYNVDPAKVVRGQYVDCMTFLNAPEYVYLDCYIKGYTVGVQFWQELVPLLCKGGYYEHQKLSEVGWLSDDQINCWMELIIRARPPGARYTVAKTGMSSLHMGSQKFILETDEHIIGMLDGSSRPYPSWDDVDIVYMPLHCNGNHWVTCVVNLPSSTIHVIDSLPNDDRYHTLKAHLSKWTSLLNVMLLKDGHFQRTRRLPYNFKLVYNDGFCFPIPRQRNFSDCGVVTGWVIESLCSDMTPVVDGDPNIFFSVVRVNMASRFYDCRCEDTSQCGYD